MKNLKRCGRLDDHDAHYWEGDEEIPFMTYPGYVKKVEYHCIGHVTVEGGHKGVK
jgi:hypothetical protein